MSKKSGSSGHSTGEEVKHVGFSQVGADGEVRATFERPTISRRVAITSVPVPTGEVSRTDGEAIGSPGTYDVTLVLSTPGDQTFVSRLDVGEFLASGTSLLQMPDRARQAVVTLRGADPAISYTVTANPQLLASTAVVSVVAPTFAGAEQAAHDLVAPMLSWWSYRYDVPIELKGWTVRERATNITRLRFGVLARPAQTDNNTYVAKPEYRFVLSAYREGMNATNPMYQACCFYRVIEGAHRLRRVRRLAVGAAFREPANEAIPSGDALEELNFHERAAIRPYGGRSFGFVRDHLRGLVRNAATHLDPTGQQETLIADELADLTRCEDATLVLKYMARVILDNEFRADPDVAALL